jgi:hypothetical protein
MPAVTRAAEARRRYTISRLRRRFGTGFGRGDRGGRGESVWGEKRRPRRPRRPGDGGWRSGSAASSRGMEKARGGERGGG